VIGDLNAAGGDVVANTIWKEGGYVLAFFFGANNEFD